MQHLTTTTRADNHDQLMRSVAEGKVYRTAAQVRRRYGNISDMTLWRWLKDDELGFPKPTIINGRRYWDGCELDKWDARNPRAA